MRETVQIGRLYGLMIFWTYVAAPDWREVGAQFRSLVLKTWSTVAGGGIMQGLLLAWVTGLYAEQLGAGSLVAPITVQIIISVTAVLFVSLLFASQIGSAFTVEIGSMQMSGQLEALHLMNVEPMVYVVNSRVIASLLTVPTMLGISLGVSVVSTGVMLNIWLELPFLQFVEYAFSLVSIRGTLISTLKGFIMIFVVASQACFYGLLEVRGARHLGQRTTQALVLNFFSVLIIELVFGIVTTRLGIT